MSIFLLHTLPHNFQLDTFSNLHHLDPSKRACAGLAARETPEVTHRVSNASQM